MFFAREKELASLTSQINSGRKCAVMIYGKRRVGKTALIQQAARSFDGIFVNHTCVRSSPAIMFMIDYLPHLLTPVRTFITSHSW